MKHDRNWREGRWRQPRIKHAELTKYNWLVLYPKELKLGKYVDIGAFTLLQAQAGITIEDHVQVGGGCKIYSVSTIDDVRGPVVLKHHCKIGANTVILPNVTVGEYAVVGACSLVKKDIPRWSLAWGIPAKIKKSLRASESKKEAALR